MKAIIVYYSYSGNTKKIADILKEYIQKFCKEIKIIRLEAQDESASFFRQSLRAFFHKKAKITSELSDLSHYDFIFLGSPVWAFAPAPAINAYLEGCFGLENKLVVLFVTYGSGLGVKRSLNYIQGVLSKSGVKEFRRFSIQQLKVHDKEFVSKIISENLRL